MARAQSAGLLVFRNAGRLEVLIGHMGGPFWSRRDRGAWSIPKGEYRSGEDPLDAARREFGEETGQSAPIGEYRPLGEVRQAGGKVVKVWAVRADLDASSFVSNTVRIEWPRGSGHVLEVPEIDRFAWHGLSEARQRLVGAQTAFLDRLEEHLCSDAPG